VATRHHRRAAVRQLFLVLRLYGLADGDPTLDLRLPPRSSLSLRALDDDEIELCRWASLATLHATRQPAVWALTEAGSNSGESSRLAIADVISESTVLVSGGRGTRPRLLELSSWGALQVCRRVSELSDADPSTPLVYEGNGSARSRQSSIASAIGMIFRRAGLGRERDLRPESVRAWLGGRVWNETNDIEAVANRLGLDSLDRAARLIGRDWRVDAP
jgi:site-specific recombinase XerD